jgi:CopG-like RHH_1 or ribbon-helix-helix domain, RHH_5
MAKRISVSLDDELYDRLTRLAIEEDKSIAQLAALLIDRSLFPLGRPPVKKEENRGGRRPNAGRKPNKS